MALLSDDEKRALRQKQRLLYSSGQFPLGGGGSGGSRRARRRMSPMKALLTGLTVGLLLLIGLVVLLTKAANASELPSSQVRAADRVAPQDDG